MTRSSLRSKAHLIRCWDSLLFSKTSLALSFSVGKSIGVPTRLTCFRTLTKPWTSSNVSSADLVCPISHDLKRLSVSNWQKYWISVHPRYLSSTADSCYYCDWVFWFSTHSCFYVFGRILSLRGNLRWSQRCIPLFIVLLYFFHFVVRCWVGFAALRLWLCS